MNSLTATQTEGVQLRRKRTAPRSLQWCYPPDKKGKDFFFLVETWTMLNKKKKQQVIKTVRKQPTVAVDLCKLEACILTPVWLCARLSRQKRKARVVDTERTLRTGEKLSHFRHARFFFSPLFLSGPLHGNLGVDVRDQGALNCKKCKCYNIY